MATAGSARVMLVFSDEDKSPVWTLLDHNFLQSISDFEKKIKTNFLQEASTIQLYLGQALVPSWESSTLLRDGDEVYVSVSACQEMETPTNSTQMPSQDENQDQKEVSEVLANSCAGKKKKKKKKEKTHSAEEAEGGEDRATRKKGRVVKHSGEEESERERPRKKVRLSLDSDRNEASADSGLVVETAFPEHAPLVSTGDELREFHSTGRKSQTNPICTSTPVENVPAQRKSSTAQMNWKYRNPNRKLSVGNILEFLRTSEGPGSGTVALESTQPPTVNQGAPDGEQEDNTASEVNTKRKRTRRRKRKSSNSRKMVEEEEKKSVDPVSKPQEQINNTSSRELKLPRHKRPANVRVVFDSDSGDEDYENCSDSAVESPEFVAEKCEENVSKSFQNTRLPTQGKQMTAAEKLSRHSGQLLAKRKPDTPMPGTAANQFKVPAPIPVPAVECKKVVGTDGVATFVRGPAGAHVHQLTPYPRARKHSSTQQPNDEVTHSSVVVRNSSPQSQSARVNGVTWKTKQTGRYMSPSLPEVSGCEDPDGSYTELGHSYDENDDVDVEMDAHVRKNLSGSLDSASLEQARSSTMVAQDEWGLDQNMDYAASQGDCAGQACSWFSPRDYSKYPLLKEPPCAGSTIAYKVVELSTLTYTPEVSEYKEGLVLGFDPKTGQLILKPLNTCAKAPRRRGKFDVVIEDDDGELTSVQTDDQVVLTWSDVHTPRIIN